MKLIDVNLRALQDEIRRLASEKPDYTYSVPEDADEYREGSTGCLYTVTLDGEKVGSCIVGQALLNLGVSPEDLSIYEFYSVDHLFSDEYMNDNKGFSDEEQEVIDWILGVQMLQDKAHPWGIAVQVNEAGFTARHIRNVRFGKAEVPEEFKNVINLERVSWASE